MFNKINPISLYLGSEKSVSNPTNASFGSVGEALDVKNLQSDTLQKSSVNVGNKVSFSGLSGLVDYRYRMNLAKGINKVFPDLKCKVGDLQSIVGVSELKSLLKNASAEEFSVGGSELENVKNGIFRINLHTHTKDSDGKFSVEELLDTAAGYADKINKKVYVGVTNHDSINDLATAIKLVAANKEKYKNLKVVLGVEFNAKHDDKKAFKNTMQLEMLGYCINPFSKKFVGFFTSQKEKNAQYASSLLNKINARYGSNFKLDGLKEYDSSIRNCGSSSFLWKIKEFLINNLEQSGKNTKYVEDLFTNHAKKYGELGITPVTPSMNDVVKIVRGTSGMVGLAHPVRIRLGRNINLPTREKRETAYYSILHEFLLQFKKMGGQILEGEYQYKPSYLNHPNKKQKREFIKTECQALKLLSSGGLDNHNKDLFRP